MRSAPTGTYQVDAQWRIVRADDGFCRALRCTESGLRGRDIRDLLRPDWRPDFRGYVARVLVGVGDREVTLPIVAPCGEEGWFKHNLEPLMVDGLISGYRASIVPVVALEPPRRRWFERRSAESEAAWSFEPATNAG